MIVVNLQVWVDLEEYLQIHYKNYQSLIVYELFNDFAGKGLIIFLYARIFFFMIINYYLAH